MKEIFLNNDQKLRSGWKIAIFAISFLSIELFYNYFLVFDSDIFGYLFDFLVIFLLTGIILKLLDKKSISSVGLRISKTSLKEFSYGVFMAFLMATIIFAIELWSGMIEFKYSFRENFTQKFCIGFIFFMIVAGREELLFRGYIFQRFMEGSNKITAVLIISLLFGAAHLFNPNINAIGIINIVLAGILFSLAYLKKNSLWLPIGIHFSWNFFIGVVYSFPVSGLRNQYALLYLEQGGNEFITGGNFGPEGGILTTIMLISASFYIYKLKF